MMNKFLIQIGLLVLAISFTIAAPPNAKCEAGLDKKADEAFARAVLYGDAQIAWPTNDNELKKICDDFPQLEKTMRAYVRGCVNGLTQQVLSLVLKGSSGMAKRFCKGNDGKIIFNYSQCGNSDQKHDHGCMRNYVKLSKNCMSLEEDLRIPAACCTYNEFESCILNRLRKEPKCSADAIAFFKRQLKSISGDALDLVCNEYKNNPNACTPIMQKMKPVKMNAKSILLPLVKIMESLA